MTPDERKNALRAEVQATLQARFDNARKRLAQIFPGSIEPELLLIASRWQAQALWEIIDRLVEESAAAQAVLAEFRQDIEAVGLEQVSREWPDLVPTYRHACAVRPEGTEQAAARKLEVETAGGTLAVEPYGDPNYPGFTLLLNGQQCAVFEYDSTEQTVRLHCWFQAGDESDPDIQMEIRPADQENQ